MYVRPAIAQLALDVIAGDWVNLYRAPGPRERIAVGRAVGELLSMVTERENTRFFAFLTALWWQNSLYQLKFRIHLGKK